MIGLPTSQVVVTFEPCMYVAICSGSVSAAHTRSGVAATSVWAVATYPAMCVSSSNCMTHSYNNQMAASAHPRLENLLASLSLNLAEESQTALERAAGLSGSATAALLALEEFLGDAHVGRLADVLGLTHSGAVRLVTQLEREGLASGAPGRPAPGARSGSPRWAAAGRPRPGRRGTRWCSETTSGLDGAEADAARGAARASWSRPGSPAASNGAARASRARGGAAPATSPPAADPRAAARPRSPRQPCSSQ